MIVTVKIVTWNVNSLRVRLPRVLELLTLHEPDVVLLQETKSAVDGFPSAELAAAGYGAVHHSGGRWAGVGLLARDGLSVSGASCGLPGEPDASEARWCEATVEGVRFASVYVPNGRGLDSPEFPRKLAFLDAVVDRVAALAASPFIVGGDFNVTRADIDVYDAGAFIGSTHVTPAERSRFEAMLDRGGLRDAYRVVHPDDVQFTWWDYRAGHFHKGLGLRIDYVLISAEMTVRLRSCGIDRNFRKGPKPSDHAPLLAELE